MTVSIQQIVQRIEKAAPKSWAENWDNVGLLVGDGTTRVSKVLIALDGTLEVVEEAAERGAQLIIAHHPLLFKPLKNLRADNPNAEVPIRLLQRNIAYYAAHTNLDQSELSSSWTIGQELGLQDMEILAVGGQEALCKLAVFVPATAMEKVRQALVQAGAGAGVTDGPQSQSYAECFFAGEGTGMFRALAGANPFTGNIGELTKVPEIRLESILPQRSIERAIRALRRAHPYEEPAYDIIPLANQGKKYGYGVIGRLGRRLRLSEVAAKLRDSFVAEEPSLSCLRLAGNPEREIGKIAIVNGSGGSFLAKAVFQGADLLISGDIDHHTALDALAVGISVADLGHYCSEAPMMSTLCAYLQNDPALKQIEFMISKVKTNPWRN